MNCVPSNSPPFEYRLTLNDGCSWWLSGANDCTKWIDRLSIILELDECGLNGSPKLIFSSMKSSNDSVDRSSICVAAKLSYKTPIAGWSIFNTHHFSVWCSENIPDVYCELNHHDGSEEIQILHMWHALFPIYQRSICLGGLPFHAGLIELDGRGIMLAASGDIGKSTCCYRLPDYWRTLCDDETLVVLDKHKSYHAHPFPTWSDHLWKRSEKTWNVQYSVPLAGVFFIEQAQRDKVISVGEGQATVLMTESASQICEKFWRNMDEEEQRESRRKLFNNACEMAKQIPAYRLCVSRYGRFWEKIESVLGK